MGALALDEIKSVVKELLKRYHAEYALLFGSYARGGRQPEKRLQRRPDQPRGRLCRRPDGQEDDRVLREEPVTSPVEERPACWSGAPFYLSVILISAVMFHNFTFHVNYPTI